jgi:aminomethyltransferase
MAEFGGWEMPLEFEGTLSEHRACREACAVFDVSHLGTVRITDPEGTRRVMSILTNDLAKIQPGRAQYTHLLDDDGSVLDDIIIWWHEDGTLDVMPNASNTDRVLAALGGRDITSERAVLAVQGPLCHDVLAHALPAAAEVGRFRVRSVSDGDGTVIVAGTGYTGELGVEIAVPADRATDLFDRLIDAGGTPAGLGARDTLRLEAGLPLHGHELGPGITPLQAGLGWVLSADGNYRGASAVTSEREAGPHRLLRGIATEGRRPPREGATVHLAGASIGTVTSGNFSPTLGHGIAMAFLPPTVEPGTKVEVEIRGSRINGTVTTLPFLKR